MGCGYFQDKTNIKSIRLDKDHSPIYYGTMETNKKSTTKDMVNLLNEDYKETMNSGYKRSNRFSGESIQLTKEEANKYDAIINNEYAATQEDELRQDVGISELWNAVRRDLDWFRKHNPKAYMVLLD